MRPLPLETIVPPETATNGGPASKTPQAEYVLSNGARAFLSAAAPPTRPFDSDGSDAVLMTDYYTAKGFQSLTGPSGVSNDLRPGSAVENEWLTYARMPADRRSRPISPALAPPVPRRQRSDQMYFPITVSSLGFSKDSPPPLPSACSWRVTCR